MNKKFIAILVSVIAVCGMITITGTVEANGYEPALGWWQSSNLTSGTAEYSTAQFHSAAYSAYLKAIKTYSPQDYHEIYVANPTGVDSLADLNNVSLWYYCPTGSDPVAPLIDVWLDMNDNYSRDYPPSGDDEWLLGMIADVSSYDTWVEVTHENIKWVRATNGTVYGDGSGGLGAALTALNDRPILAIGVETGGPGTYISSRKGDQQFYIDDLTINRTTYAMDSRVINTTQNTGYNTIQEAIDAASPGDTINVAAGTYDEQVVINESLTLQGAGDTTIIKPSSFDKLTNSYSVGTRTFYPIVVATTTGGSVTMKDFMVDGSLVTPPTDKRILGVHYRETGGVIDNVDVQHIRADNVNKGGDGILALAESYDVTTEIKNCEVTDWDKGGIWAQGNKQIANIHDNIVTGRGSLTDEVQNAIEIAYGANGTVTNNQVSNVAYTGTGYWWAYGIIFGDASGTAIGNILTNCQAGIGAEAPNSNSRTVTISNNIINATGLTVVPNVFGIYVCTWKDNAVIDATIKDNDLSDGGQGNGIQIGDTAANKAKGKVNATIEGNEVSNWLDGIWLGLTSNEVAITGNTITNNIADRSGIHIDAGIDAANVSANFNNIVGNQGYGVYNGGTEILDATNNWWGHKNGPSTDSVTAGDKVSDNVNYDPWLMEEDGTETTEVITNTGTNASATTTNVLITVTGGTATTTITVAEYAAKPETGFITGDIEKYIDVYVPDATDITELEIRLYYTDAEISGKDESTLKMYWWDGGSWGECSDTGVNTGNNYIWAKIRNDTRPTLSQLTGTPFGAGGSPLAVVIGGQFVPTTTTTTTTKPKGEVKGAATEKDGQTVEELMARVIGLRTQLEELQRRLSQLTGKVLGAAYESIPQDFTFKTNLKEGDSLIDVKYLQIILNSDPDTRLALSGVGSPGHETNYFGPLTKAAVIKFQEKYASEILAPWNLTKGTGLVGSTSRAKLNQMLGR